MIVQNNAGTILRTYPEAHARRRFSRHFAVGFLRRHDWTVRLLSAPAKLRHSWSATGARVPQSGTSSPASFERRTPPLVGEEGEQVEVNQKVVEAAHAGTEI
jgi:hypothetical protein